MKKTNFFHSGRMAWAVLTTRLLNKPRLLTVQMMLNYTCNQHCRYCSAPFSKEVMEFKKAKKILLYLKEIGVLQVSFAGGEPTIYPHYKKIVQLSRKMGFYVTVSTNGKDNRPIIEAAKSSLPHLVSVSLDGPAEVHDLYRGKSAWQEANATLKALKQRRIPRAINAVIGKHNCKIEVIRWLLGKAETVGANFNFQLMLPRFDAQEKANPLAPDIKKVRILIKGVLKIPLKERKHLIFGDNVLNQFLTWDSLVPPYRTKKGQVCFAGRNFAFITPSGILAPCSLLEGHPWYKENSLFKKGFEPAFETIKKIPCNDCYLGCNILRNRMLALDLKTLGSAARMVLKK